MRKYDSTSEVRLELYKLNVYGVCIVIPGLVPALPGEPRLLGGQRVILQAAQRYPAWRKDVRNGGVM